MNLHRKSLVFSNSAAAAVSRFLVQFLLYLKPSDKDDIDPLFGLYYNTFEYLSQYLVVKFHWMIFQSVEDVIDFVEAGFSILAFLHGVGDLRELKTRDSTPACRSFTIL